jgi:hypothetical protein
MAAYNKFNDFSEQLAKGAQNFGTDTYKAALSNTAPVATNTILSDITQISAVNGYTSGGTATTISVSETTGTTTVSGTQVVFTASGGSIGPFRYVVLYNDTTTSPNKPLVAWWDYGSSLTLADGETFTVKFSNTTPGAIFTLA